MLRAGLEQFCLRTFCCLTLDSPRWNDSSDILVVKSCQKKEGASFCSKPTKKLLQTVTRNHIHTKKNGPWRRGLCRCSAPASGCVCSSGRQTSAPGSGCWNSTEHLEAVTNFSVGYSTSHRWQSKYDYTRASWSRETLLLHRIWRISF